MASKHQPSNDRELFAALRNLEHLDRGMLRKAK
jgi:hypothetical protein